MVKTPADELDPRRPETWPQFLTTADVALVLAMHPLTVTKFLKEGRLPGRRLGKNWRTDKDDLIAYVRAAHSAQDHESTTEQPPQEESVNASDDTPSEREDQPPAGEVTP